ncbi:MAG TPA: hypothetical protein VFJ85_07790 [Acidimicrobiales bacterium]|nr:hypothetical protein [Acidimicrobiales bacterium]
MSRIREHKVLYVILGLGAALTFFGHAMWAVRGKDTFVKLLTGTLDKVGITMSAGTGENWVKGIGLFDIVVALVMGVLIIGAWRERGRLYRLAYSPFAMVVFGWGAAWGFLTALSRVTSASTWYPEVWDWVERAPNFMIAVAMVYVISCHRTLGVPSHAPSREEILSA